MDRLSFEKAALERGFCRVFFLPPVRVPSSIPSLVTDPYTVLEDAKTVILLIMAYAAGQPCGHKEGVISSYYPASNRAFKEARALADELRGEGCQAISNVQIPLKKYLCGYGLGSFGRNSLIAVDGVGSAFHVQAILTNACFPYSTESYHDGDRFSDICASCGLCVKACPTGAIGKNGMIDVTRCLRSVSEQEIIPKEFEKALENRILGCDVCQSVCPRNAVSPKGQNLTVPLKALLNGEIEDLKAIIGTNYARKRRLRKKAAVVAANLGRRDLKPELMLMSQSDDENERNTALRALQRLEDET